MKIDILACKIKALHGIYEMYRALAELIFGKCINAMTDIISCQAALSLNSSPTRFLVGRFTILFAQTSFAFKLLTPLLCCGAPSRSFGLKIMPPSPRQHQHGVRKDSLHLPRFYSRSQVQFYFFHKFAFCSFLSLTLLVSVSPFPLVKETLA